MKRKKFYFAIFILVIFVAIAVSIYRIAIKRVETNNFNQAKLYVESYGWRTGFWISADTLITEAAHLDFDFFRHQRAASQDVGLDYLEFKDKKVKLYAFGTGKDYRGKQIYAHVLIYKGKVIGAYLQSQADNTGELYVFSLKDQELKNPYKN